MVPNLGDALGTVSRDIFDTPARQASSMAGNNRAVVSMSWCGSRVALAAISAARSPPNRVVSISNSGKSFVATAPSSSLGKIVIAPLRASILDTVRSFVRNCRPVLWFQSYRRFAYREFALRGNEAVPVLSYTQSVSLNKKATSLVAGVQNVI